MARYGFAKKSTQVFEGLFEAAMYFDLHHMPELFCGFSQEKGVGPVRYPVACAPQAWSAASLFMLFSSMSRDTRRWNQETSNFGETYPSGLSEGYANYQS